MLLLDEWVDKAEEDYRSAVALNRKRKEPIPGVVCYYCQQCTEKYLKAYLVWKGIMPPLIHNLIQLLNQCIGYDSTLLSRLPHVRMLNPYGVAVRYPGMTVTVIQAKQAVKLARNLRRAMRRRLGL